MTKNCIILCISIFLTNCSGFNSVMDVAMAPLVVLGKAASAGGGQPIYRPTSQPFPSSTRTSTVSSSSSNGSSSVGANSPDESYFDSFRTDIQTACRWQSSEEVAVSMARTCANLLMRNTCKSKGYQTYYSQRIRASEYTAQLMDLDIDIERMNSNSGTRYRGRIVASALCARP